MDDQSMTQQDTAGATQAAAIEQTGQSATRVMSDLPTTDAGAAQTGPADATVTAGATETKAPAGPDVDALQARIADLTRQNGDLTDRLAHIEAEEAAIHAAAERHAAEIAAAGEADAANAAATTMQAIRNTAAEAEVAYRMAGLHAVHAAMAVRAGVYDPERLTASVFGIAEWSDKATEALLGLGDIAFTPGNMPARDVLDADVATFRRDARANLGNLANAAASYAHLLEVAPANLPAQVAIGKTLEECFLAASMSLSGLGATIVARGAA